MENAGSQFTRAFSDEALLERLRIISRDDMVDSGVRAKCDKLFRHWAVAYQNTPGMAGIASLHKQLPRRARPNASQSKVVRENERDAERDNPFAEPEPEPEPAAASQSRQRSNSRPIPVEQTMPTGRRATLSSIAGFSAKASSKKEKKGHKSFNLEREKPRMLQTIAASNIASTGLINSLKFINRETHRVSEDQDVASRFENCKLLRRQILRYIQLVESDQWIGSLLSANDELVKALMTYEIMDKSIDDDSDSENEAIDAARRSSVSKGMDGTMPALQNNFIDLGISVPAPAKPPRPDSNPAKKAAVYTRSRQQSSSAKADESEDEEDDEDPFGDSNAIRT